MYHQNYFKHRARADTLSKRLFLGFVIFNGAIWLKVRTPAPFRTHFATKIVRDHELADTGAASRQGPRDRV